MRPLTCFGQRSGNERATCLLLLSPCAQLRERCNTYLYPKKVNLKHPFSERSTFYWRYHRASGKSPASHTQKIWLPRLPSPILQSSSSLICALTTACFTFLSWALTPSNIRNVLSFLFAKQVSVPHQPVRVSITILAEDQPSWNSSSLEGKTGGEDSHQLSPSQSIASWHPLQSRELWLQLIYDLIFSWRTLRRQSRPSHPAGTSCFLADIFPLPLALPLSFRTETCWPGSMGESTEFDGRGDLQLSPVLHPSARIPGTWGRGMDVPAWISMIFLLIEREIQLPVSQPYK